MASKTAVLFGGTGFVGVFLATHLLREGTVEHVFLCDIEGFQSGGYRADLCAQFEGISVVTVDVRREITWRPTFGEVSLIVNLAAIHREPGHAPEEYYETNIEGAKHVTSFASAVHCDELIFISSIAPYGAQKEAVWENSTPMPTTPYGVSKLVAEYIHRLWLQASPENRRLLIVRPGVVFGPTENGNVSRLIKLVARGFFVFAGNQQTEKAGIYVKELAHIITWGIGLCSKSNSYVLANAAMIESCTMADYARVISETLDKRPVTLSVPYTALKIVSVGVMLLSKLFNVTTSLHPRRVEKLKINNHIKPLTLIESGYQYRYSLASAMADWKTEYPDEWR
jgi:nucleoside-diphosphate-sugar epimerase